LKEIIMKMHAYVMAASLGLVTLGASTVGAQPSELQAVVPFGFSVGSTAFAAGAYRVERLGSNHTLAVRNDHAALIVLAQSGESAPPGKSARLVFHRYGNRYYLRGVWFRGEAGYGLPETREERESARGSHERASIPDVVTIVGRIG
jgi:hypothetical protein